ncbi:MAG: PAAR-like protein [Butyricicoccus sp.]
MGGGARQGGPIYITRGMKAMCDCGTAPRGQYLNIVKDHGVICGPEQQPALNTNDHTTDTVIGFGNCKSSSNAKLQMQKGVIGTLVGGSPLNLIVKAVSGKNIVDLMSDIGLISCKCEPDTPQVWQLGDEEHILDGAPILTRESVLYCRNGGVITIIEENEDGDGDTAGEESEKNIEIEKNEVDSAAQKALAEALEKIDAACLVETSQDGNRGIAKDGSELTTATSSIGMIAMATMATCSANIASRVLPSLGLADTTIENCIPVQISVVQREETLVQNEKVDIPSEALDSQGRICDMSKLGAFQMFQQPFSISGGGAVAAYNTIKTLSPQSAPSFAQVIYDMEKFGAVKTPSGMFVSGVSDYLSKQGYGVEYLLPGEEGIPSELARQVSMIGLSLDDAVLNYSTLSQKDGMEVSNCFSLMISSRDMEVQNGTL